jgi:drug/metabolite transporter (DMT)-like permease
MKLSKIQLAILCLIAANAIWGASSPIFKWTLQEVPPLTLGFLRFFISALILLPFTVRKLKINKDDIMLFLFLAVIGLGIRIAYSMYGLEFTPSINAPIISSATPVFLMIGSIALMHEKAKKKVITGTLLSLIGVILIIVYPILGKGISPSLIGNIFFMVSMALSVMYTLLLKHIAPKYGSLTILFWIFTIASLSLLPFSMVEISRTGIAPLLQPHALVGIGFGTIFCTCLAYILNLNGVRYINASEIGIFSYVDPFVAVLIANPLLGEHVTSSFLLGSFFVFLGIFIAEGRIHYHPFHLLRRTPQIQEAQEVELAGNEAYIPQK